MLALLLTAIPLCLECIYCLDETDILKSDNVGSRRTRNNPAGIPVPLSNEDKMKIVGIHNEYRSNASPLAANMRPLHWDDEIALIAQIWANNCVFKHGFPKAPRYKGQLGQNIYRGGSASLPLYMALWHNETHYFDLKEKTCNTSMCGHYIQMMWAESYLIGCGYSHCHVKRKTFYLFVCNYYEPSISKNAYKVGRPCSLCPISGGFCHNNMCVSKQDCEKHQFNCGCNLRCHNCGVLHKSTCQCKCPPGWDFQDCSGRCLDADDWCLRNNYDTGRISCAMKDDLITEIFCRKMCGICEDISENNTATTCCNSKRCEPGYVLDPSNHPCNCRLLCPGPECHTDVEYQKKDLGHTLQERNFFIIAITTAIQFLRYL